MTVLSDVMHNNHDFYYKERKKDLRTQYLTMKPAPPAVELK